MLITNIRNTRVCVPVIEHANSRTERCISGRDRENNRTMQLIRCGRTCNGVGFSFLDRSSRSLYISRLSRYAQSSLCSHFRYHRSHDWALDTDHAERFFFSPHNARRPVNNCSSLLRLEGSCQPERYAAF